MNNKAMTADKWLEAFDIRQHKETCSPDDGTCIWRKDGADCYGYCYLAFSFEAEPIIKEQLATIKSLEKENSALKAELQTLQVNNL